MNKPFNQMTDYERYIHTLSTTELCRLERLGDELAKEELHLRYLQSINNGTINK